MALRLGLKKLAGFSRQLGVMLDAGLPIRRALTVLEKGAKADQKSLYRRIGARIDEGQTLAETLEKEGRAFPVLFIRLIRMGEVVGGLDRVLKRLADYYDFVRAMWMRLLTRLVYPAFQYVALILVLTIVTYVRGLFSVPPDPEPARPALRILGIGVLIFIAPIVGYFLATRTLGGLRAVHEVLIRVPAVGNVMRTLALARFSWSMELMTDAGVNVFQALEWSLQATGNGAFEGRTQGIIQRIRDGLPLSRSLEMSGLFPSDYIEIVHVAEESGSMPETFRRLASNYFEKADTALRALTSALSWLIWIGVAGVIVYYIFTFAMAYIGALNEAVRGI